MEENVNLVGNPQEWSNVNVNKTKQLVPKNGRTGLKMSRNFNSNHNRTNLSYLFSLEVSTSIASGSSAISELLRRTLNDSARTG